MSNTCQLFCKARNFNLATIISSNEFFCCSAACTSRGSYLFAEMLFMLSILLHTKCSSTFKKCTKKVWCIAWICSYIIRYYKETNLLYPHKCVATIIANVWPEQFWVKQSETWNQLQISNTQMLLRCFGNSKVTHQGCKLGKRDCYESCIYTTCCGSLFDYLK